MRITKFTHSCLRVEGAGVLVVDPGEFSERRALDGADAVLLTHEHFDHVSVDALAAAARRNPQLRIFAHADVLTTLGDLSERGTPVVSGDSFEAAGYRVRAYGDRHAVIHPDIPRIANLAFRVADEITNLYHPGDSFTVPDDGGVDTLFVPLHAPWMKLAEAIDFARACRPDRAFALHDHLLTEIGAKVSDGHLERLSGAKYAHLAPGTTID